DMAYKIDALFHYLASQGQRVANADDSDDEDWNHGGDTHEQHDSGEPMSRAASMRGLELTSALMDLAKNPNMDECKAVANKGNGLLHTAFVFGKTCPSPWILMRTAINRATRAARRAREVPIDAIRCTESFTEPSVRAI